MIIQSEISDILTNGFRDDINKVPDRLGFILGAMDTGFTIRKEGSVLIAKKNLIEIICWNIESKGLQVVIWKRKEKLLQVSYGIGGFLWADVKIIKGWVCVDIEGRPKLSIKISA